jgi:hypothetical protein
MISVGPFPARIKGEEAQIHVLRNNGFCWGRVVFKDGREFDVGTNRDYYDQEDEVAAEHFERLARRGKMEAPAGWRGFVWMTIVGECGHE